MITQHRTLGVHTLWCVSVQYRTIAVGLAITGLNGSVEITGLNGSALSLATPGRIELPNAEAFGGGTLERPVVDTGAPPSLAEPPCRVDPGVERRGEVDGANRRHRYTVAAEAFE